MSEVTKLDLESSRVEGHPHLHISKGTIGLKVILILAFQSIGVVFGDLGTSPLYVYPGIFPNGVQDKNDILSVYSLILYTLTFIPVIKYVFVVLRANDNGNGGTFALYSLLCRYIKLDLDPNHEKENRDVPTFKLESSKNHECTTKLKLLLEKNFAKHLLLVVTMLGTSMVISDGILTPCISVLSAVGGIKEATSSISQDMIVWISVLILVFLFMVQRFGTNKIGYIFSPVLCVWFGFIAVIGMYNFVKYDPTILKALNPVYIVSFFRRKKKEAWVSLGGVILSTTGAEALFADVGHFTVRSIQISMCTVVYPSILLAYTGQTAYLMKHTDDVTNVFYKSTPAVVYWPMFVVAVLAAIIASQSLISAAFSIIQQSLSLGCFPQVKVVHTSAKYEGQVYIPEVNYFLMLSCVLVTLSFRSSTALSNAYGIAVVFVMTLTSALLVLVMILIWKTHMLVVIAYVVSIGVIELIYLSSLLYKFIDGGYLPIAFSLVLMAIMYIWNTVYRRKYFFELQHKISPERLNEMMTATPNRLPGLAIFYSELVQGIPPIFDHYVRSILAIHSAVIFVSIKTMNISKVPIRERFFFCRVHTHDLLVFSCVVRYGYRDARNEDGPFDQLFEEKLKEFVIAQASLSRPHSAPVDDPDAEEIIEEAPLDGSHEEEITEEAPADDPDVVEEVIEEKDVEKLEKALKAGMVHLVVENEIVAAEGSSLLKRIIIDYAFNFLKRNSRQSNEIYDIPHRKMLKVGMTYEL